ncbi:PqiC family protein [Pseudomonas sp.]|uniref:PqiC family protein n=1 Tax=Pseudomonas sp. TaxID=306 RepID=UPI003CC51EAC
MSQRLRTTLAPALLCLCAVLAGCRSAPVHYHTLTPLLGGTARSVQPGANLVIERFTVPPQVDRAQIVVRQGNNGLAILETEWWGASLADELQSALVDQLNQHPINAGRASLRVDVQRFDLVPGRYALIDVKWRLRTGRADDDTRMQVSCQSVLQTPSGDSVEELVQAQQGNVEKIASMISASGSGKCPS